MSPGCDRLQGCSRLQGLRGRGLLCVRAAPHTLVAIKRQVNCTERSVASAATASAPLSLGGSTAGCGGGSRHAAGTLGARKQTCGSTTLSRKAQHARRAQHQPPASPPAGCAAHLVLQVRAVVLESGARQRRGREVRQALEHALQVAGAEAQHKRRELPCGAGLEQERVGQHRHVVRAVWHAVGCGVVGGWGGGWWAVGVAAGAAG